MQDALSEAEVNSINRRLFDASPDLIVVTDRRGRLIRVSPSSLPIIGYRPEELIGLTGQDIIHPDDLEATRREVRAARRGRSMRHFDCRYMHKDGHPVALSWTGVWSDADQHHFFIGRDMTDRNAMEAQLRQALKMEAVGQLTGGLAHDFNNILMVVMANVEAIEEDHDLPRDARRRLQAIFGAAERAAELTRQLLAFSRKQPLQPRPTDLNELVTGLGHLLLRTLGEQVQVEQKLASRLWSAHIDPVLFETALLNLCVNARDAMPDGGRLSIETDNVVLDEDYAARNPEVTPGPHVMLAVTDTGTGMDKAVLDRVFEPFFTTKEVGKGTGLGLSMVYGFIKQSNGHIKIYSELGRGTSVRLYLPRMAAAQDSAPHLEAEPMLGGTERILLVEDDPQVRAGVLRQLSSLGYAVSEAGTADAALALLEAEPYDAVVSDMVMPGGSGLGLLTTVKRRWPKTATLLMSGYTENALMQEGRLPGHVHLLIKPFTKGRLAGALRRALTDRPTS